MNDSDEEVVPILFPLSQSVNKKTWDLAFIIEDDSLGVYIQVKYLHT